MRKKTFMAAVIVCALIVLLVAMQFVEVAKGNPASFAKLYDKVVVTVLSPTIKTYNTNTIPLSFTVETNNEVETPATYVLNNQTPVTVATRVVSSRIETGYRSGGPGSGYNESFHFARYTLQGDTVLSDLADGTYTLTVQWQYATSGRATLIFAVETRHPSLQIALPKNTQTPSNPSPNTSPSPSSIPSPSSSPTQLSSPNPTTTISPSPTNSPSPTIKPKEFPKTWVEEAMAVVRVEAVLAVVILVVGGLAAYFEAQPEKLSLQGTDGNSAEPAGTKRSH